MAERGGSAASRSSPGRRSRSRRWRSTRRCARDGLAGDAFELVAECSGFIRCQFDDESATALQRYPHNDAAPLLGRFQRTVSGPGLHRRHRVLPPGSSWPTVTVLAEVGDAPSPPLNCKFTPLLFPIRPGRGTCPPARRFGQVPHDAESDGPRSEEHTSELQSRPHLVCRPLLENKKKNTIETSSIWSRSRYSRPNYALTA